MLLDPGAQPLDVGALLVRPTRGLDHHRRIRRPDEIDDELFGNLACTEVGVAVAAAVVRVAGVVAVHEVDPARQTPHEIDCGR